MSGRGNPESSGFGERLKSIRGEKGLTLKELGELSGIYPNTIAKFERGEHEPGWPVVIALAKALGISCEAFSSTEDVKAEPTSEPEGGKVAAKKKGKK
jgi:transcriptional regulator with XRE-family HTH domain